jgi:tetratricopeptide (TPR) repeat protein
MNAGDLERAINLIKLGDINGGKRLLAQIIKTDPKNEHAWLWLSTSLDDQEHARYCLQRALEINPQNQAAKNSLNNLQRSLGSQSSGSQILQYYPVGISNQTSHNKTTAPLQMPSIKQPKMEEDGVQRAITLINAGKKSQAEALLNNMLKSNCDDENVWLWLGYCSDLPDQKKYCYQEMLRINPNNGFAKNALKQLEPFEQLEPRLTPQTPAAVNNNQHYLLGIILAVLVAFFFTFAPQMAKSVLSSAPFNRSSQQNTAYAKSFITLDKNVSCYHDSTGKMIIEGKVKNTSSSYDLQFVELQGTVVDKSRNVINTNTSFIGSDILYHNTASTYKIYVNDPAKRGINCTVEVENAMIK